MNLRPWQLSPSQVTDKGESPWPVGTSGFEAWYEAQAWRREIRQRDRHYFDCENDPDYWGADFFDDNKGTDECQQP
jgi:hypothetical protein